MAKIVDYTVREWPADSAYKIRLIDTYGPGPKYRMPAQFLAAIFLLLVGLISSRVDLVHINISERLSVWRKLSLVWIAQLFGRPVVLHMHGAEFVEFYAGLGGFKRGLVRNGMRACSTILVLGSYWRDFVIQELAIDPQSVETLWNAVPAGTIKDAAPAGPCRYLFLGVVCERKGADALLHALASPSLAGLSWDAVIAGGGELDRYKTMARELGLYDRIRFAGQLSESQVRAELAAADVMVLPSRNEGLPLAILEAMSFGCAVVATPVGSISDAVIDGETGTLVKVADVPALSAALTRLAADRDYCRALGDAGRARFEAHFCLSQYVRSLESIYDRCLAQPDTSGRTNML